MANDEEGASIDDQLSTVRRVVQLLRTPDGRKKAEEALIEHWEKLEEAEKEHVN